MANAMEVGLANLMGESVSFGINTQGRNPILMMFQQPHLGLPYTGASNALLDKLKEKAAKQIGEGVTIYATKCEEQGDSSISKHALVTPEGNEVITDNVVPQLRQWQVEGYIIPLLMARMAMALSQYNWITFSALRIAEGASIEVQKAYIRKLRDERTPFWFTDINGNRVVVLLQKYVFSKEAEVENALKISCTLVEYSAITLKSANATASTVGAAMAGTLFGLPIAGAPWATLLQTMGATFVTAALNGVVRFTENELLKSVEQVTLKQLLVALSPTGFLLGVTQSAIGLGKKLLYSPFEDLADSIASKVAKRTNIVVTGVTNAPDDATEQPPSVVSLENKVLINGDTYTIRWLPTLQDNYKSPIINIEIYSSSNYLLYRNPFQFNCPIRIGIDNMEMDLFFLSDEAVLITEVGDTGDPAFYIRQIMSYIQKLKIVAVLAGSVGQTTTEEIPYNATWDFYE